MAPSLAAIKRDKMRITQRTQGMYIWCITWVITRGKRDSERMRNVSIHCDHQCKAGLPKQRDAEINNGERSNKGGGGRVADGDILMAA